jgi:hypothetical protein
MFQQLEKGGIQQRDYKPELKIGLNFALSIDTGSRTGNNRVHFKGFLGNVGTANIMDY